MDIEEFRKNGKEMIDFICDYMGTLGDRKVLSQVQPGYLRPLVPPDAPQVPDKWADVMAGWLALACLWCAAGTSAPLSPTMLSVALFLPCRH